ncbi:GtrA family protein [Vibrio diazotrophicus]|uniref:GtrA family protein n=1 Tax=Vibrio diazotrophicus TaxID=685 RepID=UPI000DDAE3BA|nr:GtrA family protein [Vibrio diazotrophicus]
MNRVALGFVAISGIGWIVDFSVMSLLVNKGGEPGVANFISACLAASLVYWSSRKFLFQKKLGLSATGGFAFYLIYTFITVVLFSTLIHYSSLYAFNYGNSIGFNYSLVIFASLTKMFYTPINLLINYLVSCSLAKRF